MRRPVRFAPFWWMMTRYWGFPKVEYQILTSRSPLGSGVFDNGRSPAVAMAASFVSKIASEEGPVSLAAKVVCCASDELDTASNREAENVSRLMQLGRFWPAQGHILW